MIIYKKDNNIREQIILISKSKQIDNLKNREPVTGCQILRLIIYNEWAWTKKSKKRKQEGNDNIL